MPGYPPAADISVHDKAKWQAYGYTQNQNTCDRIAGSIMEYPCISDRLHYEVHDVPDDQANTDALQ